MRPRLVAIFDNVRQEITLVTPVRPDGRAPDVLIAEAHARLAAARAKLDGPTPAPRRVEASRPPPSAPASNTPPARYREMVEAAKA
jgi:anthranilate synthase component 1